MGRSGRIGAPDELAGRGLRRRRGSGQSSAFPPWSTRGARQDPSHPRGGIYRNRGGRQVERRRRVGATIPPRLAFGPNWPVVGRSQPSEFRRSSPGRSDPAERDPRGEGLCPFAGDASDASLGVGLGGRCRAGTPGGGLRPRVGRNRGHWSKRFRNRRSRGDFGLRDDARVRGAVTTREDRHDRPRGFCRAQQVRPTGRGRCASRCAQAVAAKSRGRVDLDGGRDARRSSARFRDGGPGLAGPGDGSILRGATPGSR